MHVYLRLCFVHAWRDFTRLRALLPLAISNEMIITINAGIVKFFPLFACRPEASFAIDITRMRTSSVSLLWCNHDGWKDFPAMSISIMLYGNTVLRRTLTSSLLGLHIFAAGYTGATINSTRHKKLKMTSRGMITLCLPRLIHAPAAIIMMHS